MFSFLNLLIYKSCLFGHQSGLRPKRFIGLYKIKFLVFGINELFYINLNVQMLLSNITLKDKKELKWNQKQSMSKTFLSWDRVTFFLQFNNFLSKTLETNSVLLKKVEFSHSTPFYTY